jgi:hypothetical protein
MDSEGDHSDDDEDDESIGAHVTEPPYKPVLLGSRDGLLIAVFTFSHVNMLIAAVPAESITTGLLDYFRPHADVLLPAHSKFLSLSVICLTNMCC